MKKGTLISIILAILLAVSLVFNFMLKKDVDAAKKLYTDSYSQSYSRLTALNYGEFQKKVADKEEFYVYVGRPNCGDCKDMEDYFIGFIDEYNLQDKIYYFNCKELRADEPEWEKFKTTYGIKYTPTLAKFKDGKIESISEWTPELGYSSKMVEEWLEENNLK